MGRTKSAWKEKLVDVGSKVVRTIAQSRWRDGTQKTGPELGYVEQDGTLLVCACCDHVVRDMKQTDYGSRLAASFSKYSDGWTPEQVIEVSKQHSPRCYSNYKQLIVAMERLMHIAGSERVIRKLVAHVRGLVPTRRKAPHKAWRCVIDAA